MIKIRIGLGDLFLRTINSSIIEEEAKRRPC